MRKIFRGIVTGAMIFAMSSTAFATEIPTSTAKIEENGGSQEIPVVASYVGETTEIVYDVEVEWTAMNFTYTAPSKGIWDPEKHEYTGADPTAQGVWSDPATITITNHSNSEVLAALSYQPLYNTKSVEVKFNDPLVGDTYESTISNAEIASADNGVDGAAGVAQSKAFNVQPSGRLTKKMYNGAITTNEKIGTITVTITGKE